MIRIRPVEVDDAATLAEAYRANWSFLAPWQPLRDEVFFTEAGQRELLEQARAHLRNGTGYPCAIEYDERLVGTATLAGITRGAAQCAYLGYWVAEAVNGRGIATEAVRLVLDRAFGELGLHRVQAETLLHNVGSQKALDRNGFTRIGVAESFLKIAGEWQDCVLFQRLTDR